jgi:hypothetical protein
MLATVEQHVQHAQTATLSGPVPADALRGSARAEPQD